MHQTGCLLGAQKSSGKIVSESLWLRDEEGWRTQWIIGALNPLTNYTAYVIQDKTKVSGPIFFVTKSRMSLILALFTALKLNANICSDILMSSSSISPVLSQHRVRNPFARSFFSVNNIQLAQSPCLHITTTPLIAHKFYDVSADVCLWPRQLFSSYDVCRLSIPIPEMALYRQFHTMWRSYTIFVFVFICFLHFFILFSLPCSLPLFQLGSAQPYPCSPLPTHLHRPSKPQFPKHDFNLHSPPPMSRSVHRSGPRLS